MLKTKLLRDPTWAFLSSSKLFHSFTKRCAGVRENKVTVHALGCVNCRMSTSRDAAKRAAKKGTAFLKYIELEKDRRAQRIHPNVDVAKDLQQLIATNMNYPVNWYPETRKLKRKIIYHSGPTNSGKTYTALKRFMEAETGVYLAPLRLLAIECFTKTNKEDVPCDLLTGERKYYIESEDCPANHRASTIELLDISVKYDVAVIDEIQMIGDLFRGGYWTQSVLGVMADEVHVCGDGSALKLVRSLAQQCGDSFEVKYYERKTPLSIEKMPLGTLENIRAGDCIVCFTVKQLFNVGEQLKEMGHNCALIYGALPPGIKIKQTEMFNDPNNSCNVLVATDAVGMGLNLAIQRIIFYDLEKLGIKENDDLEGMERYSKEKMMLTTSQAKQIAGRAGRFGELYAKGGGQVTALHDKDLEILRKVLTQGIPNIKKAGLVLREDVLETFAFYFPGMPFSEILTKFIDICEMEGQFFMCDASPLVTNAKLIDHVDMALRDKLIFCQVPMKHTVSARVIAVYVQMARHVSKGHPITLNWFLRATRFTQADFTNIKHFDDALEVFHLTDIYLWLSFKFQVFQNIESMREFRIQLDKSLRSYVESNYSSIHKAPYSSTGIEKAIEKSGISKDNISRESTKEQKLKEQNLRSPRENSMKGDVSAGDHEEGMDASLKEEKKKKGEMEPPSTVPSRSHPTQSQPVGVLKPATGVIKKSKGNPPIQSPPSEEVEEILQKHLKIPYPSTKHRQHTKNHNQEQKHFPSYTSPKHHSKSNILPRLRRLTSQIGSLHPKTQEKNIVQNSSSHITHSDKRMNGFMYFLQKKGMNIGEGSLKWRELSSVEKEKYIKDSNPSV